MNFEWYILCAYMCVINPFSVQRGLIPVWSSNYVYVVYKLSTLLIKNTREFHMANCYPTRLHNGGTYGRRTVNRNSSLKINPLICKVSKHMQRGAHFIPTLAHLSFHQRNGLTTICGVRGDSYCRHGHGDNLRKWRQNVYPIEYAYWRPAQFVAGDKLRNGDKLRRDTCP